MNWGQFIVFIVFYAIVYGIAYARGLREGYTQNKRDEHK